MTPRTIILPGGAGYLGRHLAHYFAQHDYQIVILTRHSQPDTPRIRHLLWDGRTIGPWAAAFDNAHAVINLAGRSVNCRYTARNKKEIYDSRLRSTAVIGQVIAATKTPPPTWINASSATLYRDARDRPMDELTGELGQGFSVDVCQKWEQTLNAAQTPHTRKIPLRSAMVFGPGKGGVFEAFHRIVRLGLGGTLGRGDQYVSWVHFQDFCRAVHFILDHPDLTGPVNVASPNPIPNKQFMRTLRQAAHKKIGLPATKWMLEIGALLLRTETELLLKSRRVIPTNS
ncbi:MAG: hypothetical protein JWN40_1428 [Phycisphaerales bacterium]|nr:hypothetical protein [Phycisphaerales bacterium]